MIVLRSWVMAEAVTAIAGIVAVAGLSRICRNAVMPSIPGSWMSIKMRSGWRSRASRTPSSPVSASATRYPLTCSTSRTSFRFLSLSSTIRISSFAMTRRQRKRERRALTHLALHPDPAAVQLDELPRQRQPEPRAFDLLGRRPDLPKLLEDRLLVLRGDTDPGVRHGDLRRPVLQPGSDVDPAPLRRELQRVG